MINKIKSLKLEKNIHLIGYCKKPIDFLKNIDVFILPSIDEGLPIALLEAMACGLPIITTNVGAIPKVIKNGYNGLIGPAHSESFLYNSLKYVIENGKKVKIMRKNAFNTVNEKFSHKRMAEEYAKLYEKILGIWGYCDYNINIISVKLKYILYVHWLLFVA